MGRLPFTLVTSTVICLVCGAGCRVAIRPEAGLQQVSLAGNTIRAVVTTWTLAANPISGPKEEDLHQYLLTYELAENSDRAAFLGLHELPRLRGAPYDGIGELIVAPSGLRAVRVREPDTA